MALEAETEPLRGSPIVLHVEDNDSNRRLVERVLSRRPELRLVEAETGAEGLELAQTLRPRLILLDLRLPDVSGDVVLQKLRHDERTSDVYVVVITAEARPAEARRLVALGADEYLIKPIDIRALLDVVDRALEAAAP